MLHLTFQFYKLVKTNLLISKLKKYALHCSSIKIFVLLFLFVYNIVMILKMNISENLKKLASGAQDLDAKIYVVGGFVKIHCWDIKLVILI